jgi:hypothetical protein
MTGGSITGTASTYQLNGTSDQTLTLLSNLINLTVNKASGEVVLGSDVTVNTLTNLTAGKINLGNYNYTVGNSGSISNYNASKYFIATGNGILSQRVTAGGNKIFPVGSSTDYYPATVALTGGSTADNFNVRIFTTVYSSGTTGSAISTEVANNTWMITESVVGGSNATVTLQWPASAELSGFNRTACRLARHTGVVWDYGTVDLVASGSDPFSVSRSGFTSFSPFTVGSTIVLPLTWMNVWGEHQNNGNHIYWSAANEIDNDHFSVEASVNGTDFYEIGRVTSQGNSGSVQNYSFIHTNLSSDVYYYRIKQADIDGSFTYSKVIKITGSAAGISSFIVYPNPVKELATLKIISTRQAVVSLIITDMFGKNIFATKNSLVKGENNFTINMNRYPAGIYNLVIDSNNGNKQNIKIMKQ